MEGPPRGGCQSALPGFARQVPHGYIEVSRGGDLELAAAGRDSSATVLTFCSSAFELPNRQPFINDGGRTLFAYGGELGAIDDQYTLTLIYGPTKSDRITIRNRTGLFARVALPPSPDGPDCPDLLLKPSRLSPVRCGMLLVVDWLTPIPADMEGLEGVNGTSLDRSATKSFGFYVLRMDPWHGRLRLRIAMLNPGEQLAILRLTSLDVEGPRTTIPLEGRKYSVVVDM